MHVRFLEREKKADRLDIQGLELEGLCLAILCKEHPVLWAQFKAVITKAEELAAEWEKDRRWWSSTQPCARAPKQRG